MTLHLSSIGHVLKQPLSRVQAVIGIAAGIISISGAVYSSMQTTVPAAPGEIVAVVLQARSQKPIPGATVEVYTSRDALVTTLSAREGRVRHTLREGDYKLRVFHPRYGVEVRQIQVQSRQTSEVRVGLLPRTAAAASTAPPGAAPKPANVNDGVVKRFFRKLGFD